MRIAWIVCGTLAALSGCNAPPPHAGQPTVQGQSMQQMLADINQIRGYVYGDGTQADADKAAVDLLAWSRRMGELFPPGQASVDYVDMSPARASGAPVAMTRAAEQLLATVRLGKRPAIGDQLAATERDGCGFCHLSTAR
jgi:hypothetical protein